MDDLISRSALLEDLSGSVIVSARANDKSNAELKGVRKVLERINIAPAVDAVEVQAYNELREDFVDYVCSGIPNPAPYCANASEKCVDKLGWCGNGSNECKGFCPKHYRERKTNDD